MAQPLDANFGRGDRLPGRAFAAYRIPKVPSPISVFTAEEIALTKATNLEDILGKMTGCNARQHHRIQQWRRRIFFGELT